MQPRPGRNTLAGILSHKHDFARVKSQIFLHHEEKVHPNLELNPNLELQTEEHGHNLKSLFFILESEMLQKNIKESLIK